VSTRLFPFVIKRLLESLITALIIGTITFVILHAIPGGPFDEERVLPAEIQQAIQARYHLNGSLFSQYLHYWQGILHGDWGQSLYYQDRSVGEIIAETFPVSFHLGAMALVFSFALGLPLGLLAAARKGKWLDRSSMILAISGISLPSFLLASLLILIFSSWLGWLPPAQWEGPSYYVLPVLALGLRPLAMIARLIRASSLEVVNQDFVRAARARGLSEWDIYFKHVLKNSLGPLLGLVGPLVANILSGSFIIELLFNIPGLGKHLINSVNNRDYPLVLALTLLYSLLLLASNLVADLVLVITDPRVELS
jgi:oligopeptide transport system permease protein